MLDGFTVTGDGSNGLTDGTTHTYPWNPYGEHLEATGKQVWGRKVSDPHGPADVGGGAEDGTQRIQVDVRWPLTSDVLDLDDYEQLVEDEVHRLIRGSEKSIGGTETVIAHVGDAQSVLEDAGQTVVRGITLDVLIDRIETYA